MINIIIKDTRPDIKAQYIKFNTETLYCGKNGADFQKMESFYLFTHVSCSWLVGWDQDQKIIFPETKSS